MREMSASVEGRNVSSEDFPHEWLGIPSRSPDFSPRNTGFSLVIRVLSYEVAMKHLSSSRFILTKQRQSGKCLLGNSLRDASCTKSSRDEATW